MSEELKPPPYRCKVCNKMIERAFAPLEPTELFKKFGGVQAVQLWEEQLAENSRLQAELKASQSEWEEMFELRKLDLQELRLLQSRLATAEAELKAYREGGLTEEILRRNDGYIKVGKGCAITLEAKEKE